MTIKHCYDTTISNHKQIEIGVKLGTWQGAGGERYGGFTAGVDRTSGPKAHETLYCSMQV